MSQASAIALNMLSPHLEKHRNTSYNCIYTPIGLADNIASILNTNGKYL